MFYYVFLSCAEFRHKIILKWKIWVVFFATFHAKNIIHSRTVWNCELIGFYICSLLSCCIYMHDNSNSNECLNSLNFAFRWNITRFIFIFSSISLTLEKIQIIKMFSFSYIRRRREFWDVQQDLKLKLYTRHCCLFGREMSSEFLLGEWTLVSPSNSMYLCDIFSFVLNYK